MRPVLSIVSGLLALACFSLVLFEPRYELQVDEARMQARYQSVLPVKLRSNGFVITIDTLKSDVMDTRSVFLLTHMEMIGKGLVGEATMTALAEPATVLREGPVLMVTEIEIAQALADLDASDIMKSDINISEGGALGTSLDHITATNADEGPIERLNRRFSEAAGREGQAALNQMLEAIPLPGEIIPPLPEKGVLKIADFETNETGMGITLAHDRTVILYCGYAFLILFSISLATDIPRRVAERNI